MKQSRGELITELLFVLTKDRRFSREEICESLAVHGAQPDSSGLYVTFRYHDLEDFFCLVGFSPSGEAVTISLCLRLPNDATGWDGWSKAAEMERLEKQGKWMRMKGIKECSSGRQRISNCFSPQDGGSSITISFDDIKN